MRKPWAVAWRSDYGPRSVLGPHTRPQPVRQPTPMSSADLSLPEARRLALAAQGFDRSRPRGRVDARHVRRTIRQLGLLQLDFVNVLIPSHYLVLFSRLGPYARACLDDLVYRRREFTEHWAH